MAYLLVVCGLRITTLPHDSQWQYPISLTKTGALLDSTDEWVKKDCHKALGMSITVTYESRRLRRQGLDAEIFDPDEPREAAAVLDISTPGAIDQAWHPVHVEFTFFDQRRRYFTDCRLNNAQVNAPDCEPLASVVEPTPCGFLTGCRVKPRFFEGLTGCR
jgi:hypothetical protein